MPVPHPKAVMRAYLGLGSNVGDRRAHLVAAVAALPAHGARILGSSSVYETEPVGLVAEQRDFLNACLRVETDKPPQQLLETCKLVERELGRSGVEVRHGPREIDIDLLLADGITVSAGRLLLPHPSILERRFVLVPLLELDPGLALPDGTRLRDALQALPPGQALRRAGPPLL
jgi:2-amino-4-hydroxy-6-hydroxymethyldihydropteridine diphosphokinase